MPQRSPRPVVLLCGSLALLALAITTLVANAADTSATERGARQARQLEQIRGFSIQLTDPNGRDKYIKAIDDLADMGCTWVNFVIAARQEDVKSESIHIDWRNLPMEGDIKRILRHAKSRNMSVMLMPIVLLNKANSKEWRGVISPKDWDAWFASYDAYINFVVQQFAIPCNVDIFCVGSELLSSEPFRERWVELISEIRNPPKNLAPDRPQPLPYTGKLTYSANWDHYDSARGGPTFWDKLDYIGMNNYNELADKPGASVEQLDKAWEPIKRDILKFVDQQKKPFFFTEVGWHNLENTINQPWNYVADGEIRPEEQFHAYESFVDTWKNVPHSKFMGAFIWEWRPGADGAKEHGSYSLQNTLALGVVKKWMAMK
ncbi:MAG TPA: hypothetical protein VM008_19745 [Phycisphaerae bacterium]|nr:hypothetical protein [Phycisphaerae bacterium]